MMSYSLEGQKILLVAPEFFGYEKEIIQALTERGAEVDFLKDRPFSSSFMAAVTRFRRGWIMSAADRYYQRAQASRRRVNYDVVFVINGQTLSELTLRRWRESYKNARFLLYMWDSFKNRNSSINSLRLFDQCFTFDRDDSTEYNLHFRPLFFSKGFEQCTNELPDWDISFIGTAHTDRFAIISAVAKELDVKTRAFWYLYLQARWVFWAYKLINRSFRNANIIDFKFKPLDKSTLRDIFSKSRVILDIEHPKQTGLTMRTLETLGARKKLITTNRSVKDYDFYLPENICIIDRKAPHIPEDFLRYSYKDINPIIYRRYQLDGWIDEIFGLSQT